MTEADETIAIAKTQEIERYGVMGYPISHSRSPMIHRLFSLQTNEKVQYESLEVSPDQLETAILQFRRTGGRGLNITVPHKSEVVRLVDQLSDRAAIAGAANTLSFKRGEILGDNTDGVGLIRDLGVNLDVAIEDARILVLGAGGATRGIVGPLLEMKPELLQIANRSLAKAEIIANIFASQGNIAACQFDAIPVLKPYDLVINATSAGLRGEEPPWPDAAVSSNTFCYDLSYGLKPTPFSLWAKDAGAAKSVMGWGMLVEQAAESFNIWRGVRPETAPVLKGMPVEV